ncbi:MAG: hypothetical protein KIY12_06300 [Thermoplasmata archaeon]|uniref:Thiamine pyrophosphate enzyme N-terminal TPP-binding domain-containing protein n=1 Tax=Candidatus Sysuiplasma superficiale TaxID=2823368 RepID=A0A8J7YP49_9ARCH|nr:hypothetical protein [Candidatus Sysuiplasma superficiale]MBX8644313.1 hypothetical protein [Candidatus Sysuiplasma superficiale]
MYCISRGKLNGHLAACVGGSCSGAVHFLDGIYEAMTLRLPLISLTGQVDSDLIVTNCFQKIDSEEDALMVMETACRNSLTM